MPTGTVGAPIPLYTVQDLCTGGKPATGAMGDGQVVKGLRSFGVKRSGHGGADGRKRKLHQLWDAKLRLARAAGAGASASSSRSSPAPEPPTIVRSIVNFFQPSAKRACTSGIGEPQQ